jgi:hypothetical protein
MSATPEDTRYRCFLPDLTGFAQPRRAGSGFNARSAVRSRRRVTTGPFFGPLKTMAERVGFEPTIQLVAVYTLSRRAPSTELGHLSAFTFPGDRLQDCLQALPIRRKQYHIRTRGRIQWLSPEVAERVGFEPTCPVKDNPLSRRARYGHFGTSPLSSPVSLSPPPSAGRSSLIPGSAGPRRTSGEPPGTLPREPRPPRPWRG